MNVNHLSLQYRPTYLINSVLDTGILIYNNSSNTSLKLATFDSDTSNVLATIINIFDFDDFVFPNVLTANSDGTNDELNLFEYFKTCEEYTLYIFNRWGNKVFEQTLYSPQFKCETISGDILEEGVYFYKLIVRDAEEDKSVKHGYIHIVK